MRVNIQISALFFALLVFPTVEASAVDLIPGLTGDQCAARGGTIRTWTNTAGTYPNVGECYIAAPGGYGGGYGRPVPNDGQKAAAVLGLAAGAIGILDALQKSDTGSTVTESYDASPPPPAAPATGGRGDGLFERGRKLSQINPCRAARSFELAAQFYEQEGNSAAERNAVFQASFNDKECKEKVARDGTSATGSVDQSKNEPKAARADCSKSRQKSEPVRLHINTSDVFEHAKSKCGHVEDQEGLEFKTCVRSAKAQIIMEFEPDIRASCRAFQQWPSSMDRCAVNQYDKLWQATTAAGGTGSLPSAAAAADGGSGQDDCAETRPREANVGEPGPDYVKIDYSKRVPLKSKLKRSLEENEAGPTTDGPAEDPITTSSIESAPAPEQPAKSALSESDDAYKSWARSTGSTPGYRADGTFEPHPDMTGLEPTAEMRREMRELLQDNSAQATFPH